MLVMVITEQLPHFTKQMTQPVLFRNTAGTWFILPDTRGYALRGLDVGASVDPDGASRDVGSVQVDAFQGHIFYNGVGNDTANIFVYGGTTNEMPGSSTEEVVNSVGAGLEQGLTSAPKTDGW